jgi:AraC-like DNA-binding protein
MGELSWSDLRHAPVGPIVWVGRHRSANPVTIPGHRLDVWQACVAVTGRLQLLVDGAPRLISGGQWILVPPGTELGSSDPRCRGLFYWIGIDPSAIPHFTRAARGQLEATLKELAGVVHDGAEVIRRQGDLVIQAAAGGGWGAIAAGLALIDSLQTANTPADSGVGPALMAMRADPARDWTVEQLAGLCNLRPSRFHARFRREVGRTPHAALVEVRLQAAALRLASGEDLHLVTQAAGFASRRGFERAFRLQFGVAPGRWRGATRNGFPVAFGNVPRR